MLLESYQSKIAEIKTERNLIHILRHFTHFDSPYFIASLFNSIQTNVKRGMLGYHNKYHTCDTPSVIVTLESAIFN